MRVLLRDCRKISNEALAEMQEMRHIFYGTLSERQK